MCMTTTDRHAKALSLYPLFAPRPSRPLFSLWPLNFFRSLSVTFVEYFVNSHQQDGRFCTRPAGRVEAPGYSLAERNADTLLAARTHVHNRSLSCCVQFFFHRRSSVDLSKLNPSFGFAFAQEGLAE